MEQALHEITLCLRRLVVTSKSLPEVAREKMRLEREGYGQEQQMLRIAKTPAETILIEWRSDDEYIEMELMPDGFECMRIRYKPNGSVDTAEHWDHER